MSGIRLMRLLYLQTIFRIIIKQKLLNENSKIEMIIIWSYGQGI